MADSTVNRIDGFEVLTKLTKRSIVFVNVVFALREKGEAATADDVARRFKDCTQDLAKSVLHAAADAGALTHDGEGGWHVTPEGLAAMRVHFIGWSDIYDGDAEERGLR